MQSYGRKVFSSGASMYFAHNVYGAVGVLHRPGQNPGASPCRSLFRVCRVGHFGRCAKMRIFTGQIRKTLNAIDLIVCLVLVLAVWNGWRQGFVVQVFSLAGIVAGIWFAARYGAAVGQWLRLDDSIAAAGGFVVVLLAVLLLVAVAGRLVRKLFRFVGFGIPDIVLGIAVSVLKYLLLLSVLFSVFDTVNADYALVKRQTVAGSKTYGPVLHLSQHLLPFLERVGERVPAMDLFRSEEPAGDAHEPLETV